jgi:hypothetical protein
VAYGRTSSVPPPTDDLCNAADASLPMMVSTSFARGVNCGVKRYSGLPTSASFRELSQGI